MSGLRGWWTALSDRERRMIGAMLVVVGGMVLWLGVWRPVEAGIADGWVRHGVSVDLNASVRAKVAALKALPARGAATAGGDIGQSVAQSASEAGLPLDRADRQGAGRLAVTIGQARGGALLAWLATLEGGSISVETISISAGATPGTVSAQMVLKAAGA